MALQDYARNVFAAQQMGDLSFVTIVITASGRDASRSSPDTTVGAGASGAYVCTMPGGERVISVGQEVINHGTNKASITALAQSQSVVTFTATASGGSNLTSTQEMHLTFLVGRN